MLLSGMILRWYLRASVFAGWNRKLLGGGVEKVRGIAMSDHLQILIEAARTRSISAGELQAQRRSFAYGNTKIENDRVTREMVDQQDELLQREAQTR
jgi:hypothetical protein